MTIPLLKEDITVRAGKCGDSFLRITAKTVFTDILLLSVVKSAYQGNQPFDLNGKRKCLGPPLHIIRS